MPKKKDSVLRDRVEEFIKQKGTSVRAFEASIGLPNGTISQFTDNTSRETLCKISEKCPDFDVDFILTGRKSIDDNIYKSDIPVPYEFVERLFEERKTHDQQMNAIIEENRRGGERIDTLLGLLKEQTLLLKKMNVQIDKNATCAAVGGAE